jgi:formamidopyrimidine-DNA glycosylase
MPELPEVETTCRGIRPFMEGQRLTAWHVREPRLRWPIDPSWPKLVEGQQIQRITRRSKYIIVHLEQGQLLAHLGMSGQFRVLPDPNLPPAKHDHCDWVLSNGTLIRYRDPRRFGAMLWTTDWEHHPLIRNLGPEPLSAAFNGDILHAACQKRSSPIKSAIMDASLVVGVGNIYANEALFMAGIHPLRRANRISLARCQRLAEAIQTVLTRAIAQGGTTLRDYVSAQGESGYFRIELQAYGRAGQPCVQCQMPLIEKRLGGRSTVYCKQCQH